MRSRLLLALATMLGVASPAHAQWANQPSGLSVISDWPFSSLAGNGWQDDRGNHLIASDGTAPQSPSNVYQQVFYTGMPAGISPAGDSFTFPAPASEAYVGFWWKPSAGFENHPVLTKILFLSTTQTNPIFFYMSGSGPSVRIGMQYQNGTIDNSHISGFPGTIGTFDIGGGEFVTLGQWAKLELYVKRSTTTTSRDGIFRYWVNGVLAREFTNMNFEPYAFNYIPIAPIWGGTGGTKTRTDTFSYDHIRIASNNCPAPCSGGSGGGTAPPPPPPLAPNRPTNLRVQ